MGGGGEDLGVRGGDGGGGERVDQRVPGGDPGCGREAARGAGRAGADDAAAAAAGAGAGAGGGGGGSLQPHAVLRGGGRQPLRRPGPPQDLDQGSAST